MVYCTCIYITKYGCVFLKLAESIYVAMDLFPILLGSLPLAHNRDGQDTFLRGPHYGRKINVRATIPHKQYNHPSLKLVFIVWSIIETSEQLQFS